MTDSNAAFLDTAYIFALVNTRDQWHARARKWERTLAEESRPLLTSEFVLTEIADGLAAIRFRERAVNVIDTLLKSSLVTTVSVSSELFRHAFQLYRDRPDKNWGLTDCTSFVIIEQYGLQDVLTTDEDFRQAGFRALLLDDHE